MLHTAKFASIGDDDSHFYSDSTEYSAYPLTEATIYAVAVLTDGIS